MDAQQFAQFMQGFQTTITQAIQAVGQQNPPQPQAAPAATPKIAVKIPPFRGDPKENVAIWLLQVQNIFYTQEITEEGSRIYYAATGFEGAALHWFMNRVVAAGNAPAFADWNTFALALCIAFQPPNYQQHL